MILQALYEYYQRKAADQNNNIAPEGWEWKEIPYEVVIDLEGKFVGIKSTREGEAKLRRFHKYLVPQGPKRSVGINPYLLWDNVEYSLGANPRQRTDVESRHRKFINRISSELGNKNIPSITALLTFLSNEPIKQIESHSEYSDLWKQMLEENAFLVFSIDGDAGKTICGYIPKQLEKIEDDDALVGNCLITGESNVKISRLHPSIKGVRGTNTSGGSLVSYNLPAFNSYEKKQNYNAPIGEAAAFSYTTALNILLGKDSPNKTSVGDSTTIFWAEKETTSFNLEKELPWYISDSPKDDPDRGIKAVKALYDSIHSGQLPREKNNRFYILGLSPNAARIAVRFWRVATVWETGEKIKMHYDDFDIVHGPAEPEYLCLNKILRSVALEYKMENVPPNLAGAVVPSIFDGSQYPLTLLQQCVRRIRAEVSKKGPNGKPIPNVTRTRAAILKAYINRFNRINNTNEKEITMALDTSTTNVGYRLGRLFAVLEKIQEEANPGINTTIRDRYYGSASSSPVAVFSQLLKLKNHHLPKLEMGRKIYFEKLIGEVISELSSFPANLSLNEQAYFSVGYYHQRQDFFTSKKNQNEIE